jgi:transcriptional regulator with PAS, ATPase and Fis domain
MSICIHKQDPVIDLSDIYSRYLKKDSSIDYFNEFIDCFLIEYGDEDNLLRLLNEKTENLLIKKLAERYRENKTLVSKKLGISRFTLRKKMDDGNSFVS